MKKRKKGYELRLLCLCMVFLCTACSKETGKTEESSPQETEGTKAQGQKEAVLPAEAPEGYVYDYQVSMDPIPKEIADLGGPCVGTMHAFPTRIEMALTQQEVEKDPKLKAEVEKCTQEVKDALTEEVGGEFEVQVMSMDEDYWEFFCRDIATNYVFSIGYMNFKYTEPNTPLDNNIYIADYYHQNLKKGDYEKGLYKITSEIFPKGDIYIRYLKDVKQTSIYVAQFMNENFNKKEEQIKILNLWEKLKKYDNQMDYLLDVGYYPTGYKELLEERWKKGIYQDIFREYEKKAMMTLIEKKELYDYFSYFSFADDEDEMNMNSLLSDYQNGTYDENQIWDYWIGG